MSNIAQRYNKLRARSMRKLECYLSSRDAYRLSGGDVDNRRSMVEAVESGEANDVLARRPRPALLIQTYSSRR
jgi:hypothetical protein